MKTYIQFIIFVLISLLALNCAHDEKLLVKNDIQFAITRLSTASSAGGRVTSAVLPDGAYVSISIETTSGISIYSFTHIELRKFGNDYITAPLDLITGSYHLTDFMIVSKNNEVLFASPKAGSSLASLVDNPLPQNFAITNGEVTTLNVQAISAVQQQPKDFGYVSFGVELTGGDFSVSLFTTENKSLHLTTGTLSIYQGTNLVYTQDLLQKVNFVKFKSDPSVRYTLAVKKEGYTIRAREYMLVELLQDLQGQPLEFFIEPALTLEVIPKAGLDTTMTHPFFLSMQAFAADSFQIDWGDGTKQKPVGYPYGHNNELAVIDLAHDFKHAGGKRFINITGNISHIFDFRYDSDLPVNIQKIDLTSLAGLEAFMAVTTWTDSPEFIDFSKNSKLIFIDLENSKVKKIDISNLPALAELSLGHTAIDSENMNEIIDQLYKNVTTNHIRNGGFTYWEWADVPPVLTPESLQKLIDLHNNYKWWIMPESPIEN